MTIHVFEHFSTVQIYRLSYNHLQCWTKQIDARLARTLEMIHKPQRLEDSGKHSLCELHVNNGLTYDYLRWAKRIGTGHVNYRSGDLLTIPCFCHSCQTPVSNDAQEAWVFQSFDLVILAPTENNKKWDLVYNFIAPCIIRTSPNLKRCINGDV